MLWARLYTPRCVSLRRNIAHHSTSPPNHLQNDLRALLRETAQPVAIVTSFQLPNASESDNKQVAFHGATLSSFTSIAMEPYPLVAFALRIPSRMAASLNAANPQNPSHMIVNLLSNAQASTALHFSRPDLYPDPFSSVSFSLSEEGLPILGGSMGAISCKLVSRSWPLYDIEFLERRMEEPLKTRDPLKNSEGSSELFIARVIRVESMEGERTSPLLYHRRRYTTCN